MIKEDELKFFTDFQTKMYDKFGYTLDKLNPTMNFWWYHPISQRRTYREIGYHNYHKHYAPRFNPIRHKVKKVLEIGVFRGHSMLMWQDYFPNAEIHGVDIDYSPHNFGLNAKDICKDQPRIKLYEMDACNPLFFKHIERNIGNDFDIIIDDGSHHPYHQLWALANYIELVKDGGYFAVEDVFMSNLFSVGFLSHYDKPYKLFKEKKFFFDELLTKEKISLSEYGISNTCYNDVLEVSKLNIDVCEPISYVMDFKDIDLKGNNKIEHYNNRQGLIFFKK